MHSQLHVSGIAIDTAIAHRRTSFILIDLKYSESLETERRHLGCD